MTNCGAPGLRLPSCSSAARAHNTAAELVTALRSGVSDVAVTGAHDDSSTLPRGLLVTAVTGFG